MHDQASPSSPTTYKQPGTWLPSDTVINMKQEVARWPLIRSASKAAPPCALAHQSRYDAAPTALTALTAPIMALAELPAARAMLLHDCTRVP
jgi:hypothetical protein